MTEVSRPPEEARTQAGMGDFRLWTYDTRNCDRPRRVRQGHEVDLGIRAKVHDCSRPPMRIALFVTILSTLAAVSAAADRNTFTLRVELEGREVEGLPLTWSSDNVILLERDGRLLDVDPRRVGKF